MISIMIVDDHPMVREGLAAMLESERDFSVSALAATGEEAVAIAGLSKPDVVLSDIRMPGIDGFGVLAKLREIHPDIRVLLMAGMPLKEEEARAREEGAKGYLPKNVDQDRLVAAIRTIAAGESGCNCRVARHRRGVSEDAFEGHHDEARLPERDECRFACIRTWHSSGLIT